MKRRVREEDEVGELNIIPYLDVVTNLVVFMLASTAGVLSLGVLDVGTPKLGAPDSAQVVQPNQEPSLTLTVGITDRGYYVAGAGGVLDGAKPEGGVDTTRPPTVPRRGTEFDYAALSAKLAEIKSQFPNEQRVIMVAEPNIPYDIVVKTMDACRERIVGSGAEARHTTLFPQVWLSTLQ